MSITYGVCVAAISYLGRNVDSQRHVLGGGLLYLLSGGIFSLGVLYDFWTLNGQVSEVNNGM